MIVTFTCKDAKIATYCERRFGAEFTDQANNTDDIPLVDIVEGWIERLAREAHRHQWWDYDETDGQRVLRKDHEGKPVLLIPHVRIEET